MNVSVEKTNNKTLSQISDLQQTDSEFEKKLGVYEIIYFTYIFKFSKNETK